MRSRSRLLGLAGLFGLLAPALVQALAPAPGRAPLGLRAGGQEGERPPDGEPSGDPLDQASPEARALWQALVDASRGEAAERIDAFHVRAQVLTRDGVKSNEVEVEYRFLEPHYIRFSVPSKRGTGSCETGRGPGEGQKAYWLKDGEEVVVLQGRETSEDRELVDRMLVVARNFLALSDLSRLRIERMERMAGAPGDLPLGWHVRGFWKELSWLAVESRDFALLHPDRRGTRPVDRTYRVEFGIDPTTHLPRLAVVREVLTPGVPEPPAAPMLFQLERYAPRDGYLVPGRIAVHHLVQGPEGGPPVFGDDPAQDIWLLDVRLGADLTEADFRP